MVVVLMAESTFGGSTKMRIGILPAIEEVRLRRDGLQITLADGANWDFYGSRSDIQGANEAISAVLAVKNQE
jgi:hypothetical protein